jgi:alpha-tubulin suppressor-like RCC1 family protein
VVGPEGNTIEGITAIGVGGEHTCARRRDGAVLCWGSSDRGQRGDGTFTAASPTPAPVLDLHDAADVAAGRQHSCARRASGGVVCWGTGTMGQIGDGAKVDRNAPVAVRGVTGAVALALGYDFSCALLGDGAVMCWGANGFGQLGDGSVAPSGDTDDLGEYDKAGPPRGPVRVRVEP